MTPGYVYLMACPEEKIVKIGHTKNLEQRLYAITRERRPHSIDLLGYLIGGKELERTIQMRFWSNWIGGEWFRLTEEITEWAKTEMKTREIPSALQLPNQLAGHFFKCSRCGSQLPEDAKECSFCKETWEKQHETNR